MLRFLFLAVLLCTAVSVRAQSLPFGDAFLPTFTFTETYTDTIVLGDFGYEQVPDGALSASARVSMKGVVVEDMFAEGQLLVITAGNLQFNLDFASAEPSEAGGYKILTWPLTTTEPTTEEEVSVGSVVLKYNASELRVAITASHVPTLYSIYAAQEAGSDETLDASPIVMSLSVGPYALDQVLLYVSGTATVFDKAVGTGDEAQSFFGLARVSLGGVIDAMPPSVKITYPKPPFGHIIYTVTDRPLTAVGTCTDTYGVAGVDVQLNDGAFQPAVVADGKWTAPGLLPIAGKNHIVIRCTDQDGHVNTLHSWFFLSLESSLNIDGAGNAPGKVMSDFFPTLSYDPSLPSPKVSVKKKEGASLVVTAVPGPTAVFDGWTSNRTLTPAQLAAPKLSFKHQPNMTLTAHFLLNPFTPVKGRYNGLVAGAASGGNGFFSATLASNGTFTGSFQSGTVSLKLKGKFSNTGRYTKTMKVGGVEYLVDLTLNVTGSGAQQITGTVKGGAVDAAVTSARATFDKLKNPAPQAGVYNVIIPPLPGQPATYPAGIGFGRVTVSPSGAARFIGRTGTTPSFNAAAQLSADGKWPFFCALYGRRGSISGLVSFDLSDPAHDLAGTLAWFKPVNVPNIPVYLEGFSGQSTLLGAKFTPAVLGQRLFLNATGGAGTLGIDAPATSVRGALHAAFAATLGTDNRLAVTVPGGAPVAALQTSLNPLTGMIAGSFTEGAVVLKFVGMVAGQKLNRAAGFFRRDTRTGAVEILPAP